MHQNDANIIRGGHQNDRIPGDPEADAGFADGCKVFVPEDGILIACFLQDLFGGNCKTFLEVVATPFWR